MTHKLFWITLCSLLSVTLSRQYDCESPPKVDHSTFSIEDGEDVVKAIYTCEEGYQMKGEASIACDLDTDEWVNDAPTCYKSKEDNEDDRPRKQKGADVPEETRITSEYAKKLDMSCVSARVTAPNVENGHVLKYDRRKKNGHVFLVALYACNENYEMENSAQNAVYCSRKSWIGEVPSCVSLSDYEEEYEGLEEGEEEEEEEENEHENEIKTPAKEDKHVDLLDADNEIETGAKPAPAPRVPEAPEEVEEEEVDEEKEEEPKAVTDINIIVPPTSDPYSPRVLNDTCGPERGGCDHECKMVLYPGENVPRIVCSCYSGFSLDPYDFRRCHDIDECQANNGGCEQTCTNVPGSFECSCREGLQINSVTGNTCEDVNECLLRNGHGPCQDTCHNVWGSYYCSCDGIPGTQLSRNLHTCQDAGECASNNGGCSHTCLPTLGRVFCICPNGLYLSEDWKTCKDINECELPEIQAVCTKGCNNTFGSYVCYSAEIERAEVVPETTTVPAPCEPGFHHNEANVCVDVDECREGTSHCENCENTHGGYECTCPAGYDLGPDEKSCVDINECEVYDESPDENGATYKLCAQGCTNLAGSYACICEENFHLDSDNRNCIRDSCEDLPRLNKTTCSHECANEAEGYVCKCPQGHTLGSDLKTCEGVPDACLALGGVQRCLPGNCVSEGAEKFACNCPAGFQEADYTCVDVDECESEAHGCSHYCTNTEGSFECLCPDGFRLSTDRRTCMDINECQENENLCGQFKLCENSPGSFRCFCPEGTVAQEDGTCDVKLNGCSKDNGGCSHECLVNGDTYECRCPVGMELGPDRQTCAYEDECMNNNNGCSQRCNRGLCSCENGFELSSDGKTCNDLDECSNNNGGCGQLCVNHPGGYSCLCANGFQMLNDSCVDIDECLLRTDACKAGLLCGNTLGAFECLCPAGYTMSANGMQECFDIDECIEANGNCSHYCINLPGGYQCSCPPGQMLIDDERTCNYVNECTFNNGGCSHNCEYSMGKVVCSCSKGYDLNADSVTCDDTDECSTNNGKCSHICLNTNGSYACACPAGYFLGRSGLDCYDLDECVANNGNCSNICINLLGSHTCACEAGYELREDRHTCVDVDECSETLHDCSHTCINVLGGYECACPDGYILGENRLTCVDVNECEMAPNGGCAHICVNALGSFRCECTDGYTLAVDGRSCVEIDFCQTDGAKCSHECRNIPGGFECTCPIGFALSSDGLSCSDVNECGADNGGCSHICENGEGSFRCSCPSGLQLAADGTTCTDVNECETNNGGCSHYCVNVDGGHKCECAFGFSLDVDGRKCVSNDYCQKNNGGCAHICTNHESGPVCSCNGGFAINRSNSSDCEDVNECEAQNTCEQVCRNNVGSFECDCFSGFAKNSFGQCEDIDECAIANGDCSAECVNTEGGYQCACPNGLKLGADKRTCHEIRDICQPLKPPKYGEVHCTRSRQKTQLYYKSKCAVWCQKGYRLEGPSVRQCNGSGHWDNFENQCVPQMCPRLARPKYGNILPANCLLGQVYVGERCLLHCPPGFAALGKRAAICNADQAWSTNSTLECVPMPTNRVAPPYIKCPQNTTLILPNGQATAYVRLEKPLTNVDYSYVDSYPSWAKNLEAHLGAGVHVITFRAHQAALRKNAICRTVITVKIAEPPKVLYCPPSYEVTMRANQPMQAIAWKEPIFESHGQLKKIYKSKVPGELFGLGAHTIVYEATNQEDLTSRCEFRIIVRAAQMQPRKFAQYNGFPESTATSPLEFTSGLLQNHESYIMCPNKPPVKISTKYSIHVPEGCFIKNILINPLRHYMKKRLLNRGWRHFTNF